MGRANRACVSYDSPREHKREPGVSLMEPSGIQVLTGSTRLVAQPLVRPTIVLLWGLGMGLGFRTDPYAEF